MWAGRVGVGRILVLVEHLLLNPQSRCRAIRYGGDVRWIGWDANTEATAAVFDTIVAIAAGKKYTDDLRYERPGFGARTDATQSDAYAPTIADFNTASFMREVAT
ncbi:MAG: hypothetical protein KKF42_04385 [Actinobacteria bacterium]|nr:hypothetical protein [Actinomycetota bacterium]